MYELINDKTLAEYEAFLQQHPKGHFAQSSLLSLIPTGRCRRIERCIFTWDTDDEKKKVYTAVQIDVIFTIPTK